MNVRIAIRAVVAVVAAASGLLPLAASAQASIEYTLYDHALSPAGVPTNQFKTAAFGIGPGLQTDALTLAPPFGSATASALYDSGASRLGWSADAALAPGGGSMEASASLWMADALTLGIASSTALPAGDVVVTATVHGTFSGATSSGRTGFELSALGGFAAGFYNRAADAAHPGMDIITLDDGTRTTSTSVAAGAPYSFSNVLTLHAPVSAVWAPFSGIWHAQTPPGGATGHGCTSASPCWGIRPPAIPPGVSISAALPIFFDNADTLTVLSGAAGGASTIDVSHTVEIAVAAPAGMYFLLDSGGLADDPQSLLALTSGVPEPAVAGLWAAGLGWLAWRRRAKRQRARPACGLVLLALAAAPAAQAQMVTIWDNAGHIQKGTDHAELSKGPSDGITGIYTAAGSAGMSTGSLKGFIHSDHTAITPITGPLVVNLSATAGDALIFSGSGGPQAVEFTLRLTGSFGLVDFGGHEVTSVLQAGSLHNDVLIGWGGDIIDEPLAGYAHSGSGTISGVSMAPAAIAITQKLQVMVTPGVPLQVGAQLYIEVTPTFGNFADADFDHTAQLGLTMPTGWSYTSQSGTFLNALPVPEPGSGALAAAGLALLAALRRRRSARRVLALAAWAALSPAWALNGGSIGTSAVRTDLYPPTGPVTPVADSHGGPLAAGGPGGSVQSDSWFSSNGVDYVGGGYAYARATESNHALQFGAAAVARNLGNFTGSAHGHVDASYDIRVEYTAPSDPLSAAIWINAIVGRGCLAGCVMAQDWQHITHGRLAYSSVRSDRSAAFGETLTLAGSDVYQLDGNVALSWDLASTGEIQLQHSGAWSASDFTAFGPTPAQQLHLYADGDPQNALPDPWGDLSGFDMVHVQNIVGRTQVFYFDPFGQTLSGLYHVTLVQDASAAENANSYNFGTMAVDFSHTSTFSAGAASDPLGQIDFSQARLNLVFGSPVPEPPAATLVLLGLAMLGTRRLRRT